MRKKQTKDSSETSATIYERLRRSLEENDYISPEQVENFLGIRPSKQHISARGSAAAAAAAAAEGTEMVLKHSKRSHSKRSKWRVRTQDSEEASISPQKSTKFKHKLSARLACMACVVGVHRGQDEAEGDVEESRLKVVSESRLGDQEEQARLQEENLTCENEVGIKKEKRVTFLSDLIDSYNQEVTKDRYGDDDLYSQDLDSERTEYRLTYCLDEVERWLDFRDDFSSCNDNTTHGSYTTSSSSCHDNAFYML